MDVARRHGLNAYTIDKHLKIIFQKRWGFQFILCLLMKFKKIYYLCERWGIRVPKNKPFKLNFSLLKVN